MKITTQSFEYLADNVNLVNQIASRARICYKSEPKGDEEPFVRGIIKKGHNSCLEMGVITMFLPLTEEDVTYTPFLNIDVISNYGYLITASIRGYREWLAINKNCIYMNYVIEKLKEESPLFFEDFESTGEISECYNNNYFGVVEAEAFNNYPFIYRNHKFIAVKFITNRAVSHELVRHRRNAVLQESQRYCRYDDNRFGNEVTFIKPTAFFNDDDGEYKIWEEAMKHAEMAYFDLLECGASPQAARTVLPNSCKTEVIIYASLRQWEHIFAMRNQPTAEPSMIEIMSKVHAFFNMMFNGMFDNCQKSVG